MKAGAAAKRLGATVKTMQRWEREGRLIPVARSQSNQRLYTESQLAAFIGIPTDGVPPRLVAYCRVSSAAQKPDWQNQRRALEEFVVAKGLANVEFVEEIGGPRDRLTRFGFEWFEHFARSHGCELLVLNQERLSPEQEMVQDMMTIVHCFSSRLYGLRNYRRKLNEALKQDAEGHAAGTSHPA